MFKDKLKRLRRQKKISQKELGKIIFVSRSTICKWEMGLGLPSDVNIDSLCEYFEVSKDWLMYDNENLNCNNDIKYKKKINFKPWIISFSSILLVAIIVISTYFTIFTIKINKYKSIEYQKEYISMFIESNNSFSMFIEKENHTPVVISATINENTVDGLFRFNYVDYAHKYNNGKTTISKISYEEINKVILTKKQSLKEHIDSIINISYSLNIKEYEAKVKNYSLKDNLIEFDMKLNNEVTMIFSFPIINEQITLYNISLNYTYFLSNSEYNSLSIYGESSLGNLKIDIFKHLK